MTDPNKLLSRKEAANCLGLKENTLAVWAVKDKKAKLPQRLRFIKIGGGVSNGGTVKYRQSVLDLFLEENTIFYKKKQEATN